MLDVWRRCWPTFHFLARLDTNYFCEFSLPGPPASPPSLPGQQPTKPSHQFPTIRQAVLIEVISEAAAKTVGSSFLMAARSLYISICTSSNIFLLHSSFKIRRNSSFHIVTEQQNLICYPDFFKMQTLEYQIADRIVD